MAALHDMHCHLDFITGGEQVAAEARTAGTMIYANTVTPEGYVATRKQFASFDNVRVGFGMHPWWAAGEPTPHQPNDNRTKSQRAAHEAAAEQALLKTELTEPERKRQAEILELLEGANPIYIGEVGLDFGWRHQASRLAQVSVFEAIAQWAARKGDRVLSLHCIKSSREVLEILESTGTLDSCTCIFHWFSGPSDMLKRAIDAGCYFSCGKRMLDTGKGREYVKAIPARKLLLETDAPPERDMAYSFADLHRDLEIAADAIVAIKGEGVLETIDQTTKRLLT